LVVELADFVRDFASGIKAVDEGGPVAIGARSGKAYQPGMGPFPEAAAVKMVMNHLAGAKPDVYADKYVEGLDYPGASRAKCDLGLFDDAGLQWAIEVKLLRMLGDNGKPNDNMISHILSPYQKTRSALTDCTKLASSPIAPRKAVVIYGFEYDDWPFEPILSDFVDLASKRVDLGARKIANYEGLVHPVHQKGAVVAWEILSR